MKTFELPPEVYGEGYVGISVAEAESMHGRLADEIAWRNELRGQCADLRALLAEREAALKQAHAVLRECKRALPNGDPYGNVDRKIDAALLVRRTDVTSEGRT